MQLDTLFTGIKLLTAVLLLCGTYLVLLPYFFRPEDFFIKGLRPKDRNEVTHGQLLFRAFGGAGLISASLFSLAWCLVLSLVVDLAWAWVWSVMTLGGGAVLGAGHYVGFRLIRYRRLAPNERQTEMDADSGLFVLRRVKKK